MTGLLEIKLPDHMLEHLPSDKTEMVAYLSKYTDEVLHQYETRFQRRVPGTMGGPLSRYEKSLLKDFVLDMILGKELREHLEKNGTSPFKNVDPASVSEAK